MNETVIARFRKRIGLSPCVVFDPTDLKCELAGASIITPAKCYLYTISACNVCMHCLSRVNRHHRYIDAGKHGTVRTPMIDFYTTAKTGVPGIPENVKRLSRHFHHQAQARAFVPPTEKQRADARLQTIKAVAAAQEKMRRGRPPKPKQEVVAQEPQKVVRRKKEDRMRIGICKTCGKRKPIKAWGECYDCAEEKA